MKGHEKNITRVIFNRDGDLLFTAASDKTPTVWDTESGERIGTYNGHSGSITDLSVSCKSSPGCWALWASKLTFNSYQNRRDIEVNPLLGTLMNLWCRELHPIADCLRRLPGEDVGRSKWRGAHDLCTQRVSCAISPTLLTSYGVVSSRRLCRPLRNWRVFRCCCPPRGKD